MKKTLTALAALLILATSSALAQRPGGFGPGGFGGGRGGNSNGYLTGTVMLNPDSEGEEAQPGEGAVIIVSFEKKANNLANLAAQRAAGGKPIMDSLFTVVGASGNFNIRNVPTGAATVKITLMGYDEMQRSMTINPGENKISVYLNPEKLTLAQSVVTAKVPPLSIVQDTIVMNASAVKFNKGEMAIDILEQMPGVEATDGGLTILGEQIQNVYVDGVLLFGNSPMTALNNLPAEEVIALKSFQEYENKDPRHKISQTESKQRVLDISTRSKSKFVVNGNVIVGGGYDTDTTYHKFRYTTGADVIASSEKLQLNASVSLNNINSSAIRMRGAVFGNGGRSGGSPDLKNLNVSISGTKKWMSKSVKNFVLGQINASYSYSDSYNVNESRSETIYFPTTMYDERIATSSSKSISTSGRHNFSLGGSKNIPDGTLSLSGSYSINDGTSESYSSNYNMQRLPGASAFQPKQGTATGTVRNTEGTSYSLNFNANKGFWNVLRLSFRASAGQSTSDAFQTKRDTTTQTITHKVLEIQTNTPSKNWSVSPTLRLELGDRQSISLSYSYRETFNQTEQFAYDVTSLPKTLDEINTRTMTNNNDTHSFDLNYNNALWKDGPILRAGIGYSSVGLAKDETYPKNGVDVNDQYDHRFNSWSPSISIGTEGMMNRWSIRYSSSSSTPSLEQVRPRLDNTNLYSVSGGNPDLKQSRSHSVSANFSTPLGNFEESTMNQNISTISFNASFRLNQNRIASNRIYFAEETDLGTINKEYAGYIMPAQSTFSTYMNVPDAYSASGSVRYDTELSFIRCNLNTNLGMSWDKTPEYVQNELTTTTNYSPNMSIGLRSNFSRNFRFNLNGRGSYIYSENTEQNVTDYFQETISAGVEINNILQKGYISGNYSKTFYQKVDRQGINDNILDMRSGLRFGPRNNIDISLVIHDIFNKTSGFSTSMSQDYVTNRWSRSFGRYVLLSLSYSFNSLGRKGGSGNSNQDRGGMPGGFGGGMPPMMMGGGMMGGFGGGRGGFGGRP